MTALFVANRMTKNPVIVPSNTSVNKAVSLMKQNNFRRLPIVDEGQLVGFVSDHDLARVMPSPATTLDRFEEKALLDKVLVKEVMSKRVLTVDEGATIEEAALIMYNNKVSALTCGVGSRRGGRHHHRY